METSLKNGFAQIFSCCPKKSELPKLWVGRSPPRPPGPYAYGCAKAMFSASRLCSSIRSPINFNRRSPEEFQWKIFLGEDLWALAVLAVLCHLDGKLFVIHRW